MIGQKRPRLSGMSLRVRMGIGVALLTSGAVSILFGWGWIAGIVGTVVGVYAGYKTPNAGI
jgi:hypothetical protein